MGHEIPAGIGFPGAHQTGVTFEIVNARQALSPKAQKRQDMTTGPPFLIPRW